MNKNKIRLRKAILDSFPDPTERNPDGITADTIISDLLHNEDPLIVKTECKFLWKDGYLEKGTTTRGGTFYTLTQKGITARDTTYNPEWIKKMEKEIRDAKENAIPRARIGSTESFAPGRKPISKQNFPKQKPPLSKNQKIELGGVLAVAAIIISVLFSPIGIDWIYPPEPEIYIIAVNAQNGNIKGNIPTYSYEPSSFQRNSTHYEEFFLTVSNSGTASAYNFWMDVDSKPDGLWFDFHNSAVIHSGIPKKCQSKSSECTIEIIPKQSGAIDLQYGVSFDHKLFLETVDGPAKVIFKYGFDKGEEKEIEIFLKFD